jgi:hypothetical protein
MLMSAASFLSLAVSIGLSFIALRRILGNDNVRVPVRIARRERRS